MIDRERLTRTRQIFYDMYDNVPVHDNGIYYDIWRLFASYAYTVRFPQTTPSRVKQHIEKYNFND